jgi:hypothetical protein
VDIRTDSLRWNKAINQISTEAHVRVVSEDGDILTGKGFISDAKLDNWQILSNVKGVFQKVTERVEQADKPSPNPKADSAAKPQAPNPGASGAAPAANGSPKGAAADSGKSGGGGAK